MIRNIFFDMDGTLLPMDMETFTNGYFRYLTAKMTSRGYEPQGLVKAIWKGTAAMVRNDGSMTNEDAFWNCFASIYGEEARKDRDAFEEFYNYEFDVGKQFCGYQPEVPVLVRELKARGLNLVLATNPIFPRLAQEKRIRWCGLEPENFSFITDYETSRYCKPNPKYFAETLEKSGCLAEETVMIGNDAAEDLAAASLGIPVFLITDCLINKNGTDLTAVPHGDFPALRSWLDTVLGK